MKRPGRWSNARLWTPLALTGIFFFVLGLIAPSADAAQIKRVQRGVAVFDSTDITNSIPLDYNVDMSKSVILISVANQGNSANSGRYDQNLFFTAQFEDSGDLSIDRAGVTGATTQGYAGVHWEVIEFASGVTVQRGISSMQAKGSLSLIKPIDISTPLNVTGCAGSIPCRAVPIITTRAAWTGAAQTNEFRLLPTFITDDHTMQLERK